MSDTWHDLDREEFEDWCEETQTWDPDYYIYTIDPFL